MHGKLAILSAALLISSITAAVADEPKISIVSATYHNINDGRMACDFSRAMNCTGDAGQTCNAITINNSICPNGDPANGAVKSAALTYRCAWTAVPATLSQFFRPTKRTVEVQENATMPSLTCFGEAPLPVHAETISIISALYFDPSGESRNCDFTKIAANRCGDNISCSFTANNGICGDPASGGTKHARVKFTCRTPYATSTPARIRTVEVSEGQGLAISCE